MAGKCVWCNEPTENRYCSLHEDLGYVLDDLDDRIARVEDALKGCWNEETQTILNALYGARIIVIDELGNLE